MADTVDLKALAEKVDRTESLEQIRLLASRYALCLDTRNLDVMVGLFVEDVQVGRDRFGRQEMKKWFTDSFKNFRSSIHFVGNHIIDFDDADNAHGVVYCRDEIDRPDGDWMVGVIQYWDQYQRRDGIWYFVRRRLFRWYAVDALQRPRHGATMENGSTITTRQLPEAWATWDEFWTDNPWPGPKYAESAG